MSAEIYGESYYRSHLATGRTDLAYERSEHWLGFFGEVAENIVLKLRPGSALDAGCALGILVETLRTRGVDARGVDVSEYAIAEAHESVRDYVRVGSLTEPLGEQVDLVTCVEVLEHLPPAEVNTAVKNLVSITDQILFSSTPDDFAEATHLNVQPPEYWSALFAEHGFVRDLDFDASFLTPWAVLYRRTDPKPADVVRAYERERWNLIRERDALRGVAVEQVRNAEHAAVVQDLRTRLRDALDAAHGADAARATAQAKLQQADYALAAARGREAEMAAMVSSRLMRVFWKLLTPYRKLRG